MATANVPLYLDWSFWAVVVAFIAVALSQLPPVHLWFRRARIDLETHSRIHITHKIGNPNLQLHLILSNVGGRLVRVKNIIVKVKRDGKEVAVLPAQNYLQNPNDTNAIMFTSFSLKPKEEWAHIVNFLNYFSRADEKRYRSAESNLRADILMQKQIPGNKDVLVETTDDLVAPFKSIFDEKFIWNPGEYEIATLVITSNSRANITKNYRFTLFESDSAELSKVANDYKYGDGINWDSGNHPGVIAQITEA
jgi:hypothetical protein